MTIAIDAREMTGIIAGKGRYLVELVKALARIDRDNKYLLYSKQPIEEQLPDNFQNVIIDGLPGFRQAWLANNARDRDCKLLFAPTGYLPVLYSKIPTVLTIHDLAIFVTKEARASLKTYLAERLLLATAVKKAVKIIAVSQSTKDDLVRLFKIHPEKIRVTRLGYDSSMYKPNIEPSDPIVLERYRLKPRYLLFLGTLEPRKNIVGLIRAYSQLPKGLKDQYQLVIGGKKGWHYDEIFNEVKKLQLEKQVIFLGRVPDDDLPALYRQAALFLFPSFYEGFGLPPLEAMACSTPVISSNLSSLPEVIGDAGILIDPYQPMEISKAIEQLLTDDQLYTNLKSKTVSRAAKFSWDLTAKETLTTFRSIP